MQPSEQPEIPPPERESMACAGTDLAFADILARMHGDFLAGLSEADHLFIWNRSIVNSSKFCATPFRERLAEAGAAGPLHALSAGLQRAMHQSAHEPYRTAFFAAVLTALATAWLKTGRADLARPLAEQAVSYSQYDLHAQSVLIEARGLERDGRSALAETDAWLRDRFCGMPFESLESTTAGEFVNCCPLWLPVPIGSFSDPDVAAVMRSPASEAVRQTILDGSFRHCSRFHCAKIVSRDLPLRRDVDVEAYRTRSFPRNVVFSHDLSCNLSCPSCRLERIVVPKSQQDQFDALSSKFLLPLMHHADTVKVCGSGDPFGSAHFRNLMQLYCRQATTKVRKLILHTNGVLCDARSWEQIGLRDHVRDMMVSLDAATAPTYAFTRRGGDFARLWSNIGFMSDMRRIGAIDRLELLFVVQARNFREMPAVVEQARKIGADSVIFQQITNWGTYSELEFREHNIFAGAHPLHDEFLDVLDSEELRDPLANMWNIKQYARAAAAGEGPL